MPTPLSKKRMSRAALLGNCLLLLTACAIGSIHRRDGTTVHGLIVGAASIETCEPGGSIGQETHSADGAMVGACSRIDGGTMSTVFAGLIAAMISGATLYFGGGL